MGAAKIAYLKNAELPSSFFGHLKAKGVNIENHLSLPEFASDLTKLKFDVATYGEFGERRLKEVLKIADAVFNPEKQ